MPKKYITVVFEYVDGARLPMDITEAYKSETMRYQDVVVAVSLENEITRVEKFEALIDQHPK